MNPRIIRLAYILLGAMTLASFGGPFLIGTVMRGGSSTVWPPDRPVEWAVVVVVTAVILVVLAGLAVLWLANQKQIQAAREATRSKGEPGRGGA